MDEEPQGGAREPRIALVLAGGGALGAYEAGALKYVLDTLPRETGVTPRLRLFAGTSVGALNATFLAAHADDPARGARRLAAIWEGLRFERILNFGPRELLDLGQVLLGRLPGQRLLRRALPHRSDGPHPPVAGVFDTAPLAERVRTMVPWARLTSHLARGVIDGLALCATEICSGTSVIFYQTAPGATYRCGRDPHKEARRVRIGADHVMASAAIPFVFPAVQVGGVCYTDGALRQNTPLNPALRMGADRVLVISVTQDPKVATGIGRVGCRRNPYPGMLFLLGRTVEVLLSQALDHELNRVELYNRLLAGGRTIYGDDFLASFNRIMSPHRNAEYRPIRTCHVRPSRSLKALALDALQEAPHELALPGIGGALLRRLLTSQAFAESELLRLLLFTATFARNLLELGYRDARAQREDLARLFAAPEMSASP